MCFGGGSSSADDAAREARQREEERQRRIRAGMDSINQTFSGFDDGFFRQRADAYQRFAMPQLEDQYTDALTELTAALARSGTLQSSIAADKQGKLQKQYSLQRQNIIDQGLDQATKARGALEDSRSSLVADLYATADPTAAAQGAAARAKIASAQPSFSPLGILFQNVAGGLADYAEGRAYSNAFSGGPGGNFSFGGRGSGKNIG